MALRLYLFVYFFGFAEEDTTVNLGITWCDWSCLAPDEYIWCYGKHTEVIPVVHTLKRTPFNIFTFRKFGAEFRMVHQCVSSRSSLVQLLSTFIQRFCHMKEQEMSRVAEGNQMHVARI